MFSKKTLWGSLIALELFTGISGVALAEMPTHSSGKTSQFQHIEQPLGLKIGVAIARGTCKTKINIGVIRAAPPIPVILTTISTRKLNRG